MNREEFETFRHELVIAACEGFRALNVLPALQRLQNGSQLHVIRLIDDIALGMELLSSLVPCLFWSSLPAEKKPDPTEKKEEKKDDKDAERKKEEAAKQRAADEAVAEPRLSQQMFLRLLATLLPFVSADKTEPVRMSCF